MKKNKLILPLATDVKQESSVGRVWRKNDIEKIILKSADNNDCSDPVMIHKVILIIQFEHIGVA